MTDGRLWFDSDARERDVIRFPLMPGHVGGRDDRLIGGLWEECSGGRCRFVMVRDKSWATIDGKL